MITTRSAPAGSAPRAPELARNDRRSCAGLTPPALAQITTQIATKIVGQRVGAR